MYNWRDNSLTYPPPPSYSCVCDSNCKTCTKMDKLGAVVENVKCRQRNTKIEQQEHIEEIQEKILLVVFSWEYRASAEEETSPFNLTFSPNASCTI